MSAADLQTKWIGHSSLKTGDRYHHANGAGVAGEYRLASPLRQTEGEWDRVAPSSLI